MFVESVSLYSKSTCPSCKKVNFMYHSNSLDDDTAYYSEAVECHNCSQIYFLGSEEDFKDLYGHYLEDDDNITMEDLFRDYVPFEKGLPTL